MSRDAGIIAIVAAFDLSRFPVPITISAQRSPLMNAIEIHVTMAVNERVTGAPITVTFVEPLSIVHIQPDCLREDLVVRAVRQLIGRALEHEIDECLYFRGARLHDPHAKDLTSSSTPAGSPA